MYETDRLNCWINHSSSQGLEDTCRIRWHSLFVHSHLVTCAAAGLWLARTPEICLTCMHAISGAWSTGSVTVRLMSTTLKRRRKSNFKTRFKTFKFQLGHFKLQSWWKLCVAVQFERQLLEKLYYIHQSNKVSLWSLSWWLLLCRLMGYIAVQPFSSVTVTLYRHRDPTTPVS
jgi:hypothetical protein